MASNNGGTFTETFNEMFGDGDFEGFVFEDPQDGDGESEGSVSGDESDEESQVYPLSRGYSYEWLEYFITPHGHQMHCDENTTEYDVFYIFR